MRIVPIADGNVHLDAPLITVLFHDLIILVIPEVANVMRGKEKNSSLRT